MGGRLAFEGRLTAAATEGAWREFFIEVPNQSPTWSPSGWFPRVALRYRPVARYTPELELGNFGSYNFPTWNPTTEITRIVDLQNPGGVDLEVSGLRLSGPDAALFSLPSYTGGMLTVPAHGRLGIAVRFSVGASPPAAITSYAASLEITSDSIDDAFSRGGQSVVRLDGSWIP
jgi:hypothetical protein